MTGSTSWRTELVDQLASGGKNAFNVVALSVDSVSEGASSRAARGSGSVEASSVPERLRQNVSKGQGAFQTYSLIRYSYGKESQPGLVVGKRLYDIDQQPYELYYLFPLTQEEKSLTLVKTTLATAGLFVVVLLGAIAWFVVRQVVTPVRMAAGIAERLSAGRLQERMKVTGEDDIARLGEAFNKMAQNLQLKIQQLEELSRMQRRFVSDVSHELRTPSRPSGWPPTSSTRRVPTSTPSPRAPPSCWATSSTGSSRCSPICWRSAGSTRARRLWRPSR